MSDAQTRASLLQERIHHEIVTALAGEFRLYFQEQPVVQSIAWRQDPEYYNDEVTRFRADIEPECLIVNGQEHEEWYEEYRDPMLKAAAAQAAAILNSFSDRLLAWLHRNCVDVTLTREGVTFEERRDCY